MSTISFLDWPIYQEGVTPMKLRKTVFYVSLVLGIGVAPAGTVIAQGMMGGTGQGMMGGGMTQGGSDQSMMGRHMQGGGGMMGHHGERGMMCPMMGGMMQGGSGHHMMRGETGGMSGLFGSRVIPTMNLSVDDVRGYLTAQLDRLGNKRLKIGDIKADGGAITADIVTTDNSLVQRMKVGRSTGDIEYEN
jgi:hypothetical protein